MLKIVFFLLVGAFAIYAAFWVLVLALHLISFTLAQLFKFLAYVFRKLELAYALVKLRCQAWSTPRPELAASKTDVTKDMPLSPESPVAPLCEAAEPATDVSNDPEPVEANVSRHETEEKHTSSQLSVPPGECEAEVAPAVPQADLQVKSQTQPVLNSVP